MYDCLMASANPADERALMRLVATAPWHREGDARRTVTLLAQDLGLSHLLPPELRPKIEAVLAEIRAIRDATG
jgi:hypothetical protein